MADISGKVAQIRQAIHGQEVREFLASGIEAINQETENTTTRQEKVEQDFEDIKANEADRVQSESTRKENEENRVSNENSRVIAENTRISNEETRKENETSRQKFINALKVCEPYDSNKTYVMYNKVTYQGSTYQCIVENVQGVTPGTDNTKWLLIAVKGQDGTGGDMFKLYYDQNGDGKVNEADSADGIKKIPVDISNIDSNYVLKYDKTKNVLKAVPEDYVIDNTPPETISNFVALAGDTKVTLNWTNPVDEDFAGVKILRKVGSYPENITDGTQVYDGTNTSYENNGLTNDTEYFYRAFPYDTSDNYNDTTEGQQVSAIPAENTDTEPPGMVNNFTATAGNGKVDLSWINPVDEDFAGVKILRKTIGYPFSPTDGDLVYNGTGTSYEDNTVENNTTYYYRIFPYDTAGNYNTTEDGQELTVTPTSYKIYGVKIDTTNSNPETAVTYTDDAVNMQGGSSDWDNKLPFNVIRPCLLKTGVVKYYLNPDDFTKKEDGTDADITSGNDGNVMIEIPKIAYAIYYEGTDLYVKITDNPDAKSIDSRFCYYAHTRDSEGDRDKLYVGAYLGLSSGQLKSLSGQVPTTGNTMETFRGQARAYGSGYDLLSFYPLTLLQCLYLIRYKNLDSQTALGRGYVDGNTAKLNTGGTNQKGMNFGETTGTFQMKFCGIEDFWGNLDIWIDGLYSDSNRHILTAFKDFNDNGNGYTDKGQGATENTGQYMTKVQGTSETGFVVKNIGGSATTFFTDFGALFASFAAIFGGSYNTRDSAGVFFLLIEQHPDTSQNNLTGRLMYL